MSRGEQSTDSLNQGRDDAFMDIDRMVNAGLGGGLVTDQNGLIEGTTVGTMDFPNSVADSFATFQQVKREIKGGSAHASEPGE